ncbi:hypothetical protein B296_00024428 [Ensete ventricosum]|uniref:Uncharacterized protein n=1 Tax=Ensete ventricosum TaxID=4639 RepID=A0A426YQ70_ENSVE|nr:hypothetical protein B296_00024428 [Ensete ventricosum]
MKKVVHNRDYDKSEDKAEGRSTDYEERDVNVRQKIIVPWYRRRGTSVELSIPYSYGGRALVVKGAKEIENAKANYKYPDKAEG